MRKSRPIYYTSKDNDFNSMLRIDCEGYPEFPNGFLKAFREFEMEGENDKIIIATLARNFLEASVQLEAANDKILKLEKRLLTLK